MRQQILESAKVAKRSGDTTKLALLKNPKPRLDADVDLSNEIFD